MSSAILVVAAVIQREGNILICQRQRGGRHELKWEFPGGKVEAGEMPEAALARELREELAIEAVIGKLLAQYEVQYGDGPLIHLLFYRVNEFAGEPVNLEFEQIAWVSPGRLDSYDFLEGDLPFLRVLKESI
jgi:8-oxo-dGTP diphosphatase